MLRPTLQPIAKGGMGGRPSLLLRTQPALLLVRTSRAAPSSLLTRTHQRRTFIFRSRRTDSDPLTNDLNVQRILARQQKHQQSRLAFLSAALLASIIWACVTAYRLFNAIQEDRARGAEQAKLEAARRSKVTGVGGTFSSANVTGDLSGNKASSGSGEGRDSGSGNGNGKIQADALPNSTPVPVGSKVVIHSPGGTDLIPTGHSTVPHFPRTVRLPATTSSPSSPSAEAEQVEYTLVGLGIRTVSFLQFSVYVVGLYVATQDIAGVQSRLVKKINPLASTLVPSERGELRRKLDDPFQKGEELWEEALFPARTALRITPVRDTNFPHLRDGFVRAISHRRDPDATKDEEFGSHMRDFKHAFNKGKLPQASELAMQRDAGGKLTMSYVDAKGSGKRVIMAEIDEPRLSRLLWLNYLTGNVASPPARESIVQGVMDFVERPVGTVAAQVV